MFSCLTRRLNRFNSMIPNASQLSVHERPAWRDSNAIKLSDIPSRILTIDSNYCVIDKPFGVRMDGDFDITVEKLMLQWVPSLEGNVKGMKWVHQLDFATSGVLCIAMNYPAANLGCSAFERRETSKEYLAVVQGHIDANKFPCLSPGEVSIPIELIGGRVQSKLERKLIMDQVWNDECIKKYTEYYNILQDLWKTSQNQCDKYLTEVAAMRAYPVKFSILEKLAPLTLDDFKNHSQNRTKLKKLIKFTKIPVTVNEEEDKNSDKTAEVPAKRTRADSVNSTDVGEPNAPVDRFKHLVNLIETALDTGFDYNTQYRDSSTSEPFIYRTQAEPNQIQINIPVAELADDFRMEPGYSGNPGKVSQTTLEILEKGYYQGRPVTKVRLLPRSGRRHQLRIHCLCLGHPIVGDFTYNILHKRSFEQSEAASAVDAATATKGEEGNRSKDVAERMMLHAHKLRIPIPSSTNKNVAAILKALPDKTKPLVDVIAEDPFVFENGVLIPVLPAYHNALA